MNEFLTDIAERDEYDTMEFEWLGSSEQDTPEILKPENAKKAPTFEQAKDALKYWFESYTDSQILEGEEAIAKITEEIKYRLPEFENVIPFLATKEFFIIFSKKETPIIGYKQKNHLSRQAPRGYMHMGGAVRSEVFYAITEFETGTGIYENPRDEDLAAIWELKPDMSLKDDVSREFMPEDFKHGHGVSKNGDDPIHIHDYMETRDFDINELLMQGELVLATPDALVAIKERRIKPTKYELYDKEKPYKSYHFQEWGVEPKLALKAIRLSLDIEKLYKRASRIEGIKEWQFTFEGVNLPALASNIQKALESGDKSAISFYEALLKRGIIKPLNFEDDGIVRGDSLEQAAIDVSLRMSNVLKEQNQHKLLMEKRRLGRNLEPKEIANIINDKEPWNYGQEAIDTENNPGAYAIKHKPTTTVGKEEYYQDLAEDFMAKDHKLQHTEEAKIARRTQSLYEYLVLRGIEFNVAANLGNGDQRDVQRINPEHVTAMEIAFRNAMGEPITVEEIERTAPESVEDALLKEFNGDIDSEEEIAQLGLGHIRENNI